MDILETLYINRFGHRPEGICRLVGAGSAREYFRLSSSDTSVIGTVGKETSENDAFLYLTEYLCSKGVPVPQILAVSDNHEAYLQDDLGDVSLYDVIAHDGFDNASVDRLIKESLDVIARVHSLNHDDLNTGLCYPRGAMDRRSVMWDLNYFKYCFLKPSRIGFDEDRLQDEFEMIANRLTDGSDQTLILRDFQSRNVMIHNGQPFIIDFQGARMGPAFYDVASFLWQARIAMPDCVKWQYADSYVESAAKHGFQFGDNWREELRINALFRMLQVLGAYGFRGLIEHKAQFVTPIPVALENTSVLLGHLKDMEMPCLTGIIDGLIESDRFALGADDGRLTVTVISFSYKKGIPEDLSGNGGGFVFDCRALHNPGRYDEYKKLTGNDEPVIRFLEQQGEIQPFLASCYNLVDHAVENYISRGFSSLMICFGCTGGRHRSLYSAEHTARHIAERYDCNVRLIHREQMIDKRLK